MKNNRIALLAFLGIALTGLFLYTGCEDDNSVSETDSFRINPDRVILSGNDTVVVLSAEGGRLPMTWSVTATNLGTVSGSGVTATYTRKTAAGANTVQVTDAASWTATAIITQEPTLTTLTITPATAAVSTNGGVQVFTAAGGTGTYSWELVTDTVAGTISHSSGNSTAYTSTGAGTDILELKDGQTQALATITKN